MNQINISKFFRYSDQINICNEIYSDSIDTLIEVIAVRKKRSANLTQDILEGETKEPWSWGF